MPDGSSLPLHATLRTRRLSWQFYHDYQRRCGAQGWRDGERWLGRNDLFYLLAVLLRRADVNRDWIFQRIREVEAAPDGRLDLWAREHYKSTVITFALTIRDILRDPEITVGFFSHTRPIAKGYLRQIKREFEANEYLRWLYSDILYEKPERDSPKWSEDDGIIVKRRSNPKEATVEAWGLVDGQPTSRHFRLRVYDDVVTRESVTTSEQIAKTTDALDLSDNLGVASSRGGAARYIGTRYNLADTYATLMQRGAVVPRIHAATHNGRFDGRPVLLTDKEWADKLKTQSRPIIASQQLQNPMADEEASFRPEWLRSYEVRPRTLNVYIMADPSRGRTSDSDNTAIAVIGLASNGAKFLLDGCCHRMTLSQRWAALRGLYHRWSAVPGVMRVAVGYERFGAQSDDEYFKEQMLLEHKRGIKNAVFSIAELSWPREGGASKRERVERLEPDFRNSRFFLPLPVVHEGNPTSETWRVGSRAATWRVETDPESRQFGAVEYREAEKPTAAQQAAMEGGSGDLLARAIKCRDQEGRLYDLTKHFIEEYLTFPFGALKDLIDATSRIYDMEPNRPAVRRARETEPEQHWDR